jgi:hypothetical protein
VEGLNSLGNRSPGPNTKVVKLSQVARTIDKNSVVKSFEACSILMYLVSLSLSRGRFISYPVFGR